MHVANIHVPQETPLALCFVPCGGSGSQPECPCHLAPLVKLLSQAGGSDIVFLVPGETVGLR